jgi:hypothetical protein
MQLEQNVIKTEYFKADTKFHIHHKNGISHDNDLNNLEILTSEEHTRKHGIERRDNNQINMSGLQRYHEIGDYSACLKGEDNPRYKKISRFSLLRLLAKHKGRISYIPGNFETYKKKCKEHNIDYVAVSQRYNSSGIYLSKGLLVRNIHQKTKFSKEYKVDLRKLYKLCEYYGINTNHTVTSVVNHIPLEVWDIEVEDTNNFIANELCVHNSSSGPNLNQLPRPQKGIPSVRECFVPDEGFILLQKDYSQIELRVISDVCRASSNDPNKKFPMLQEFLDGKDPYASTGAIINHITYEQMMQWKKEGNPKYKDIRQKAKAVKLGYNFSMGAAKFKLYAKQQYKQDFTLEEAQANRKDFFDNYCDLVEYHKLFKDNSIREVHTFDSYRRKRKFKDYPGVPALCNLPIQGGAGNIQKTAIYKLFDLWYKQGYSPLQSHNKQLLLTVHDELNGQSIKELGEESLEEMHNCMIQAGKDQLQYCPVDAEGKLAKTLADKD